MQFKRVKKNVNGVLLLDKPLGFSSNQALQKVKWLYSAAKAGHIGNKPVASGSSVPVWPAFAAEYSHFTFSGLG